MKLFTTTTSPPPAGATESLWVYNGLDCCLTLEVFEAISPKLNETTRPIYEHSLALQAPILEMMLRGVLVDRGKVAEVAALLERQCEQVKASLQEIMWEGYGFPLPFDKVPHYTQLREFFYEYLGLPPVRKRGEITTDRSALEKLRSYFHVETICNHLIKIRELRKKLGVLFSGVDRDDRIRTSFNIAGTDTGRLSSYSSAFGSGTNLQNITSELRCIFVSDPGKRFAYIDLEQAEARAVGAIIWSTFRDGKYLDFCESGDLHTNVVKMTWPELPWTGDLKKDKDIAKRPFYRDFNYRDAAKRLGHATNYHGQPPQIAREVRIPLPLVQEFQREYFRQFRGIAGWHDHVRNKLLKDGWITTLMGRQRWFFGRRWENETLNSAIAYEPQSIVADYINKGMLALWRAKLPSVEILLQIHDALLIQFDAERETELVPQIQAIMELEIPLLFGRTLKIPTEAQVGWNWAYEGPDNPNGLVKFTGNDTRKRAGKVSFMDRRF